MHASFPLPARRLDALPVLIGLFCLIWASAFAVAKVALADCPPLLLLSGRFLLAGGAILAACALLLPRDGFTRLGARDVAALALMGILNNACYLGLSYVGMTHVSSGFTAVVISANPLLTALIAAPLLGERLTPRKLLGLFMGMAGVALVVRSRIASGHEDPVGVLYVLAALVTLSAATLLFKRVRTPASLFVGSGIQSLAGGLALLPVALWREDLADIHLTPSLGIAFAYLTFAGSVGAFSLWFFILGRTSATRASALHFLMPPLGLLFGWLLLGEKVPPLDLVGIIPIALGIRLVTTGSERAGAQKR
ncbi:DMT family transporter [Xanthobacter dioxanivorans]|uniref:DMT family transporter n=1 Tax=Xanthobacter dioxanivorans TaxID=2528964 RepID=A0A974PR88_9HYPH|nr:DMT family transporter [Xanthobacter dioxanivorans]QRG08307.1 DMT family transporter [Xanthobacter dioxanivorans]